LPRGGIDDQRGAFAEAVNRLDLQPRDQVTGLPGLAGEVIEDVAEHKTRSALQPVVSKAQKIVSPRQNRDDEQDEPARRPRAAGMRTTPARKRRPRASNEDR